MALFQAQNFLLSTYMKITGFHGNDVRNEWHKHR
jgi:hypothetical protein